MNWFQNSKTKLSVILILAMMLTMVISTVASAEVWTDQEDYAPGSVVTLGGNNDENGVPGYVEGNSVDVVVSGPNDWTATCSGTVAANGAWSCTITLDSDPAIAVGDYSYTATSTDVNGNSISENGIFSDGPVASHTCIVTTDGGVKCWGNNRYGQLGDGTTTNRNTPVDVLVSPGGAPISGVVQVSTGANHTCVVTTGGGVQCWGYNYYGQLGDGTPFADTFPFSCQVFCTRITPVDVIGLTSGVVQVSTGEEHTCAVLESGGVKCWGYNIRGQLGDGGIPFNFYTPNKINTPVDVLVSLGGAPISGVVQVSASDSYTCAVLENGGAKCWGSNGGYGRLGDGSIYQTRTTPVDVFGLTSGVAQVSAGQQHACAMLESGGVKCWGRGLDGELGNGTYSQAIPTPVNVLVSPGGAPISGVAQISAGNSHTCAVLESGGLKCWGFNAYGQLGDGDPMRGRTTPVDVFGLTSGVAQVSGGIFFTCAMTTDGGVKCWGDNRYGQLGDGTTIRRFTPVDVFGLTSGACAVPEIFCKFINQPPTSVAGGPYLVAVNTSVAFDGSASSDPDFDILTETWIAAGGTVAAATYTAGAVPGIYDVCLTVNDGTVDSDPDCTIVVVYDPSAGFVTGGGWIDSPVNADYQYMQTGGKATFGFVAKYKKGANVPDGNTEFQFKAAGFNFHSDTYEWLVVNQGGANAQFRGEGTVNGALDSNGNAYKFMIWAGDGLPDTFRIKIWSELDGIETVVYDNGTDQEIGGGSIVVHK